MADKKITELTEETAPVGDDLVEIVADVIGTPTNKKTTLTNLIGKVWNALVGQIAALTEKETPVDDDLLVIEDSVASNSKKKVKVGNLLGGVDTFWAANNDDIYYNDGNVGIGTTAPGAKLEVVGGTTLAPVRISRESNDKQIGISYYPAGTLSSLNPAWIMGVEENSADFSFYSWKGSGGIDNRLYLKIDGNVGIGTTSPAQKLHVAGYARADSGFCIGTSCITAWPKGGVTGTGTANYLPRWTTSSNIGNSVIYQSGSNIGIGITSPNQQLEITGNFRVSTTTYANQSGIIYKGADRFIHNFNYGYNGTVTTTGQNTFVGINAGNFTMGNTATGSYEASRNTGIGYQALLSNTTGHRNSAMGTYALYANTTGSSNSAIGVNALFSNTTGAGNSAMGRDALYSNTTGHSNSAMGLNALHSNTTGFSNSAIGVNALFSNTTGFQNSAMGRDAGRYLADGSANQTSSSSVFLGYDTRASVAGGSNEIVIGASAIGAGSNSVVLGNDNITKTLLKGNVGIGTATPQEKLHIVGNIRTDIISCNQLGTDANGNIVCKD